jgi:hypothetical protein
MGNASSTDQNDSGQSFDLGNALDNLAMSEAWSLPKMPAAFGQEEDGEGEKSSDVQSASRR